MTDPAAPLADVIPIRAKNINHARTDSKVTAADVLRYAEMNGVTPLEMGDEIRERLKISVRVIRARLLDDLIAIAKGAASVIEVDPTIHVSTLERVKAEDAKGGVLV